MVKNFGFFIRTLSNELLSSGIHTQCRNVCGTDFDLEGVEILAKLMQNGRKKQIFGTELNLALALIFVQS